MPKRVHLNASLRRVLRRILLDEETPGGPIRNPLSFRTIDPTVLPELAQLVALHFAKVRLVMRLDVDQKSKALVPTVGRYEACLTWAGMERAQRTRPL